MSSLLTKLRSTSCYCQTWWWWWWWWWWLYCENLPSQCGDNFLTLVWLITPLIKTLYNGWLQLYWLLTLSAMRTTQDFLCLLVAVRWCDGFLFNKYYGGEALTQELFSGCNLAIFPNLSLKGDIKNRNVNRHSERMYAMNILSLCTSSTDFFRNEKILVASIHLV